jgi:hypothetical protein
MLYHRHPTQIKQGLRATGADTGGVATSENEDMQWEVSHDFDSEYICSFA